MAVYFCFKASCTCNGHSSTALKPELSPFTEFLWINDTTFFFSSNQYILRTILRVKQTHHTRTHMQTQGCTYGGREVFGYTHFPHLVLPTLPASHKPRVAKLFYGPAHLSLHASVATVWSNASWPSYYCFWEWHHIKVNMSGLTESGLSCLWKSVVTLKLYYQLEPKIGLL